MTFKESGSGHYFMLVSGCMLHASGNGSVGSTSGGGGRVGRDSSETEVLLVVGTARDLAVVGTGAVFVLVQVLCSVVAGVYNEYIIKGDHATPSVLVNFCTFFYFFRDNAKII